MLRFCELVSDDAHLKECNYRKPVEVGRFSLDSHRNFHHDRRQMSCYTPPVDMAGHLMYKLDLNDGIDTKRCIKRDEDVKERLDHLLRWMIKNKPRFHSSTGPQLPKRICTENGKKSIIGDFPDFVMWRGHLTKFLCTPYENRDGWIMACQKLDNTIYISEVESEEDAVKRRNRSERDTLMTYWGVRFEGYMTGAFPKPGTKPCARTNQTSLVTNTNKAFCAVFRTRLNGRHSLIFGAEVDCCQPVETLNPPDCYIELKTSRHISSYKQEQNFYRHKCLKWWAQSYLVGIPQITCGIRDDDGFVNEIQDFCTFDLPKKAAALRYSWKPTTCLVFLDNLLQIIKDLFMQKSIPEHKVLLLVRKPSEKAVHYSVSDSSEDVFLRDWYVNEISQ